MSINYPYQMRPRRLSEVYAQEKAVRTVQSWLERDTLPGFIFVSGNTGCGKTVLTKLLVQTTHCLNRPIGGRDNCGECAVCNSDPQLSSGYANVVWVAAEASKDADGKEITYQRSIVEALHRADRGPNTTGNPHRDVLFIAFEEAHLMPKDLFQRCLAKADAANPFVRDVVLIFLSMSPEEMPDRARQAISQRGAILHLETPTSKQIADYLQSKFVVERNIADVIAEGAGGSFRGALSLYKDCLDYAEPLTLESVRLKLGFLDPYRRQKLWQAIKNRLAPKEFRARVSELVGNTELLLLARQLQSDLDDNYIELGEELWWTATKLLEQFCQRPNQLSLTYTLLNMRALAWPATFINECLPETNTPFIHRLLSEPWQDVC